MQMKQNGQYHQSVTQQHTLPLLQPATPNFRTGTLMRRTAASSRPSLPKFGVAIAPNDFWQIVAIFTMTFQIAQHCPNLASPKIGTLSQILFHPAASWLLLVRDRR